MHSPCSSQALYPCIILPMYKLPSLLRRTTYFPCFHWSVLRSCALGWASTAAVIMLPVLAGVIEIQGLSQEFLREATLGNGMPVLVILFVKNSPPKYKILTQSNDKRSLSGQTIDKNFLFILSVTFLLGTPAGPGVSHLMVLYQQAGLSPPDTSGLFLS